MSASRRTANTVEYCFTIPCMPEDEKCPPPELPCCEGSVNMIIATEDFDGDEAETWLYGKKESSCDFGSYLSGALLDSEFVKTF